MVKERCYPLPLRPCSPLGSQLSNGPLVGFHDKLDVPLDPKKDLARLIVECKYEEAFAAVLQRSDVSIVPWLCYPCSVVLGLTYPFCSMIYGSIGAIRFNQLAKTKMQTRIC
ncbi:Hypothetical predicted protein [Olea europaea subsp. europaea]|uniref:Uncharacterized protein n=1 Tax=Olea europaea subsp. europaea TaxID=158383 RepID=A0A8S0VKX6_OLEEU|nr:Hypothetical predicted protein [Olea europaea subsp. europaea]